MSPIQAVTVATKPNITTVVTTVYNNVDNIHVDHTSESKPLVVIFKDGASAYVEGKFAGFSPSGEFIFEKTSN